MIVVDAYRQPYIPFYLSTREFFAEVREKLAPGGVVVVNVGHPEGNDDLEQVIGATMASEFPTCPRDPVEDGEHAADRQRRPRRRAASCSARSRTFLPDDLRNLAAIERPRVAPRLPGGEVYTDDQAPVEWLIDRSILGYAGED